MASGSAITWAPRKQPIPWSFLPSSQSVPKASIPSNLGSNQYKSIVVSGSKSFADVVSKGSVLPEFDLSQLPKPCLKGEEWSIKIPEIAYKETLAKCKSHLNA